MRICDNLNILGQATQTRRRDALVCRQKSHERPGMQRLSVVFVVAYALSPIDLIPDFIPVLGYVDDVLLLTRPHLANHQALAA
jgi:uncharacterized membrane protein YkvA (DUF1232 family)